MNVQELLEEAEKLKVKDGNISFTILEYLAEKKISKTYYLLVKKFQFDKEKSCLKLKRFADLAYASTS